MGRWNAVPSQIKVQMYNNYNFLQVTAALQFQSMKLTILTSKARVEVTIDAYTTVADLQDSLSRALKLPKEQLSIFIKSPTGEKRMLEDRSSKLLELGVYANSDIQVKDLGKQIKWEYVFYIEYLGPILILPAMYFLGRRGLYTWVQPFAAIMGVTHYLKRELETAFVHVFSRKTMPFKRVFINSAHYWILFALLNSVELFMFPKRTNWDTNDIMILFFVWAIMEFCNFKCHKELSSFRKKGSKNNEEPRNERGIPKTYGFKYVSCANYLWETLGWVTFSLLTKCYTSYVFTAVSFAQMTEWALKKHKQYRKEFGERYPKNRKAILPFLL